MFLFLKTNLREGYLYVQINIDEDQHVVYVLYVYDNPSKMMRLVPKYRKELFKKKSNSESQNEFYNYNKKSLIEEVVE